MKGEEGEDSPQLDPNKLILPTTKNTFFDATP